MTEAAAAAVNKPQTDESYCSCSWNPFSYIYSLISALFAKSEVPGYTSEQLEALNQEREIKVTKRYNESDTDSLSKTINKAALNVLEWYQTKSDSDLNKMAKDIFDRLSTDPYVKFIAGTVGETLVEILYRENPQDSEIKLLESIFKCFLPAYVPPKQDESGAERFARHVGLIFNYCKGEKWEAKHLEHLPPELQEVIKNFAKDKGDLQDGLAGGILHFNIQALETAFQKDFITCKALLKKVLTTLLDKKIHELLTQEGREEPLRNFFKKMQGNFQKDEKLKNLINIVLDRLVNHFIAHFSRWFTNEYSLLDAGVKGMEEHLEALSEAQKNVGNDDFSTVKLQSIKENRTKLTERNDRVVAKAIWGDNYASPALSPKEVDDKFNLFVERHNGNYLKFCFYTQEKGAHKAFKKDGIPSTELSDYASDTIDFFLSDPFLTELVNDISTHEYVKLFISGPEEQEHIKQLFPFFKLVLSVFLRNTIRGTKPENGLYRMVEKALGQKSMEKLVNTILLPSLKETLYTTLVQKIIASDISLLGKDKTDDIAKAFTAAYPNGDKDLDQTYLKKIIQGVLDKYFGYDKDGVHVQGFVEEVTHAPGDDTVKKQQCFAVFTGSTEHAGDIVPSYAEVVKMLLVDFGGLPGIVKWFFSFFDVAISTRITAFLHPYRKSTEYFARIFENRIDQYFGSVEKVDTLFKEATPPAVATDATETTTSVTTFDEISKLLYIQSTYDTSWFNRMMCSALLGEGGSRITTLFNNMLNSTIYADSVINQSLLLKTVEIVRDKVEESSSKINIASSGAKTVTENKQTKGDLCRV